MKVLFASAEVTPFAKVGGLGDVVGSLPKALRKQGVDARILMPLYGFINRGQYNINYAFSLQLPKRDGVAEVHVSYAVYDGVPVYFMSSWPFFGEGSYLYTDWEWDVTRYVFFGQAIPAVMWQLGQGAGEHEAWFADILHVHDWHTALAPFLINEAALTEPRWAEVGSVLTIHNMGYQGEYASKFLFEAGIPPRTHPDLLWQGKGDNLLGIGLAYSDMITAVSPRYAVELLYSRFGEGLEGLIRARNDQGDVYGILNGIDTERNDPQTDRALPNNFSVDNFVGQRLKNKTALQAEIGLPVDPNVPLVGMVSRLVDQKGIDLAIPALRQLLADTEVQFVALGTGDRAIEHELWQLSAAYSNKARAFLRFDAGLSQRIYGACDIFLMPSRYEPCGIGQMVAMRYGALPIVRETGGLADTVQNYDDGAADYGTGFVFLWENTEAVLNTLRWSVWAWYNRPIA